MDATRCNMGVGCDEYGVCYASSHGRPDMCPCEAPYPGQAPCPACYESSGYVWEHGNDWNSGPWSHQTNIRCSYCNGTGTVDSPLATLDDLEDLAADEARAERWADEGMF